jgi:mycofactocin system glycosyltransferase
VTDPDRSTPRHDVDVTWTRWGTTVLAGAPMRLFRLTSRGADVAETVETSGRFPDTPASDELRTRWIEAGAVHPAPEPDTATDTAAAVTMITPVLGVRAIAPRAGPAPRIVVDDGTQPPRAPRIVVDDGTQPPRADAAVRLDDTRGPAAARNAGRRHATTEYLAFVDADVDTGPDERWLPMLLAHFADPRVGLVAPRVAGEPDSPLDMGSRPALVRPGSHVPYVPAAALVVRAAAFDAVGGFDERLRFGEDVDLVWRLGEAGWWCRYEPRAVVWHAPRPTAGARLAQRFRYGTSAAPLHLRHPGAVAPFRSNGWTALVVALAALGHPGGAVVVAASTAAALPRRLVGVPRAAALGLALRGHGHALIHAADAVRRSWWPIVAIAAVVSRRARRLLVLAVVVRPQRAIGDAAYGAGVGSGMIRHRTVGPIVPRISAWPGRAAVEYRRRR